MAIRDLRQLGGQSAPGLNATVAYFGTGTFFESSAPSKDITYVAGWAAYKF